MATDVRGKRRTVDRLWPDPVPGLDLDEAFRDLGTPPAPPGRAWLAVNMVTSIDGRATVNGGAEGLAGRADRRLMRLLRAGHDAVASGVGTLRAADFFSRLPDDLAQRRTESGRPPQPTAIVIAGRGPVPIDRRFFDVDQPRIVVVPRSDARDGVSERLTDRADILVAPGPEVDPSWLLAALRERGIASVLLEGGPTTNARFLAAGVIDELYWTIGARVVANDGLPMITPIPGGSPWEAIPRLGRLVTVHRSGDDLFLRYRFGDTTA